MTRPPDPKSKNPRLIHDAQDTGQEMHVRGFKEVCLRDGLEMNRELDLLITGWLHLHNWPPGNPQAQIDKKWDSGVHPDEKKPLVPEYVPKPYKPPDYKAKPTEELLHLFDSDLIRPSDKLEIGQILRERGAYPKKQDQPLGYTPRYGSG